MPIIVAMVNGVVANSINLTDRGLAYGDGIFETMLVVNHKAPLLNYHLKRLMKGLSALSIDSDKEKIDHYLSLIQPYILQQSSPLICKIIVTRAENARGYQAGSNKANIIIILSSYVARSCADGIKVHSCQTTLTPQPSLAGIKALSALTYVLAANERIGSECDEGLLFDVNGSLIEATARNVFLVDTKNRLVTPTLNGCGVKGVMRDWLIDYVVKDGLFEVVETAIDKQDVLLAKEVFLSNSITGITPVLSWFDKLSEPSPTCTWLSGPVAQLLIKRSNQLLFENTL